MKKILNGQGPKVLTDLLEPFKRDIKIDTRQRTKNDLSIPSFKTNYFKKSFYYDVTKVWNSLPMDIRETDNIKNFKGNLHQFLMLQHS